MTNKAFFSVYVFNFVVWLTLDWNGWKAIPFLKRQEDAMTSLVLYIGTFWQWHLWFVEKHWNVWVLFWFRAVFRELEAVHTISSFRVWVQMCSWVWNWDKTNTKNQAVMGALKLIFIYTCSSTSLSHFFTLLSEVSSTEGGYHVIAGRDDWCAVSCIWRL